MRKTAFLFVLAAMVLFSFHYTAVQAQELPAQPSVDYDPLASAGQFDLRIHVDAALDISIQGIQIRYELISGSSPRDAGSEYSQPIPQAELSFFGIEKLDGRGRVELVEAPSGSNNYTARIRIDDFEGGEDLYHVLIRWLSVEGGQELAAQPSMDYDPRAPEGQFDLRVHVDAALDISIQGIQIRYELISGSPPRDAGSEYSQPIPQAELSFFDVEKLDGRGRMELLEAPSISNNYTVRIRIDDSDGGEDHYHVRIRWLIVQWQLVWSDEFEGPANSLPDQGKWSYDLGDGGWGNFELETYTNSTANAFLDGSGNLVIRARKLPIGRFTSARLKTQSSLNIAYGIIEARIKIPIGQGIWPSFWMLGSDISTVGWPASGEIDLMENIGSEPSTIHSGVHGPGYSGGDPIARSFTLPNGQNFSSAYHLFSVHWTPEGLEFFVDSEPFHKVTPESLPAGTQWVFNKAFFLILNVAVGGLFPGYPDGSTQFPQEMSVDYVRVYRSTINPIMNPGAIVNGASFTTKIAPGSLASVFGTGLADTVHNNLFDQSQGSFPRTVAGVSVRVNEKSAPLTYVSPNQINFQVPWDTPVDSPAEVHVTRNGGGSNKEDIMFSATSPAVFAADGEAIVQCSGGVIAPGASCTLWGNGFGAKTTQQEDGVPAPAGSLPHAVNACALEIVGIDALVTYCGGAPGLIIDQLNFLYPSGIPATGGPVPARITVGSETGSFQIPAPAP